MEAGLETKIGLQILDPRWNWVAFGWDDATRDEFNNYIARFLIMKVSASTYRGHHWNEVSTLINKIVDLFITVVSECLAPVTNGESKMCRDGMRS